MNLALGHRMAKRLTALGVTPDRVSIVQNWADGVLIKSVVPVNNLLRREWGKFVVCYSGNLGRAHEYHTLLDAIVRPEGATPDSPEIIWLFVGGDALQGAFASELRARGLRSVLFKPYQPRELLTLLMPSYLEEITLGVSFERLAICKLTKTTINSALIDQRMLDMAREVHPTFRIL